MPFVGTEFPARTRKGSSKYEKELELMLKKPGQVYEFEQDFTAPAAVAASLRRNKLVLQLQEENNGTFSFTSASGQLYGTFTLNSNRKRKSAKKNRK